ncbi:uncharacterized protein B0H18DRAFT_1123450 [Fomitopsis serialis]|uniref:uncharacterized protein n=1 Tax=Fomitopsis serialis TaxID=139415 RepID=UPI0020080419|nr:uncharacterized protein B0H18DRAFT_1123450 [Neoantrodia serialis]KAH9917743.1 hypothetical protein B0H18DRAFT_1123450 [Neoantrodia serialis]
MAGADGSEQVAGEASGWERHASSWERHASSWETDEDEYTANEDGSEQMAREGKQLGDRRGRMDGMHRIRRRAAQAAQRKCPPQARRANTFYADAFHVDRVSTFDTSGGSGRPPWTSVASLGVAAFDASFGIVGFDTTSCGVATLQASRGVSGLSSSLIGVGGTVDLNGSTLRTAGTQEVEGEQA